MKLPEVVVAMPRPKWHIIVNECTNSVVSHIFSEKGLNAGTNL